MVQALPEAGDERLLQLIAHAVHPAEPGLADIAAAGRSVWTWHGVSREITVLLGGSSKRPD